MSQAQRIAATIPPTPDALAVPVDVLQTIFAALFALLRRLGPMVLNAILLLNINTLAVPVAALLNDPNLLDPPADSFHAAPGTNGAPSVRNMADHGDFPSTLWRHYVGTNAAQRSWRAAHRMPGMPVRLLLVARVMRAAGCLPRGLFWRRRM